jgi:hypothetical protein
MYEALHQRIIKIEIITGETKFSIWCQHKKKFFPLNLHWTVLWIFTSAVIKGVQMVEMSKAGLTDRMVYHGL